MRRLMLAADGAEPSAPEQPTLSDHGADMVERIRSMRAELSADRKEGIRRTLQELSQRPDAPVRLSENQTSMVQRLAEQSLVTHGAFLAADVGTGKTMMTLATLYALHRLAIGEKGVPANAHIALVFCSEHIAHQWEREATRLLPTGAFRVVHILCSDLEMFHCTRILKEGSALDTLLRSRPTGDVLVIALCSHAFLDDTTRIAKLPPKLFAVVTDETHVKYRRNGSNSTSGAGLMSVCHNYLMPGGYVLSVSATLLLSALEEAKSLCENMAISLPDMDPKRLTPADFIAIMRECSVRNKRGILQQLRVESSFCFVMGLERGPGRAPAARYNWCYQQDRHGNGVHPVTEHYRFKAALEMIARLQRHGSVCFCADNVDGLYQLVEAIEGQCGDDVPVHVLTGKSTQAEVEALRLDIAEGKKIVLLMTPEMAVGLDYSFLSALILSCALYSSLVMRQVIGRMVRAGQTKKTLCFVLYSATDQPLYNTIEKRTADFQMYYDESPLNCVPELAGIKYLRAEDAGGLAADLARALPRLKSADSARNLCADHENRVVFWEALSHILL